MICNICGKESRQIFKRLVLSKYEVAYYQCTSCEFIQTEEPYWLDEAYQQTLNIEDTGIVHRNLLFGKRTNGILFFFFNKESKFVDFGGGTGLFVRLMRDFGFDFYWEDPYTKNIFARGFEFDDNRHLNIEAVTSFECFEHFIHPMKEIDRMLSVSQSVLFSTVPFLSGIPDPETWEYYAFGSGQHISFFSLASLNFIAEKYRLNLCTNRKSFHLLTQKPISNNLFNVLLKTSVLGLHVLTAPWMKSRINSDMKIVSR